MALYEAGLATSRDDAELRALLRENPMAGRISLSFEREPDFFEGGTVEGADHATVVVRERGSRRLVAMGSLSRYEAWVNGLAVPVGYLSQLRLAKEVRGNAGVLGRGFALFRELAADFPVDFFVTTIISDNQVALRFLASPKRGFPTYVEMGRMVSVVLPLWGSHSPKDVGLCVAPAAAQEMPEVAAFLGESLRAFQFAPRWSCEVLRSPERCRGLKPENFLLVRQADGTLVGCGALWDQRPFKQTVVRGYAPSLGWVRPAVNLLAPLVRTIRLPAVGQQMPYAYLSHWAARDEQVFLALVRAASVRAQGQGLSYLSLGVSPHHSYLEALRRHFRCHEYESTIFAVHWPQHERAVAAIERSRLPFLEIATL